MSPFLGVSFSRLSSFRLGLPSKNWGGSLYLSDHYPLRESMMFSLCDSKSEYNRRLAGRFIDISVCHRRMRTQRRGRSVGPPTIADAKNDVLSANAAGFSGEREFVTLETIR